MPGRIPPYFRAKDGAPGVTAANFLTETYLVRDQLVNAYLRALRKAGQSGLEYWANPYGNRWPVPEVYWHPRMIAAKLEDEFRQTDQYKAHASNVGNICESNREFYRDGEEAKRIHITEKKLAEQERLQLLLFKDQN